GAARAHRPRATVDRRTARGRGAGVGRQDRARSEYAAVRGAARARPFWSGGRRSGVAHIPGRGLRRGRRRRGRLPPCRGRTGARFTRGALGPALPRRAIVRPEAASSDDHLPTSDQVVAEFRRALHDPEHRPTRRVVARLVDLLGSNLAQWNLEDEARGPGDDDVAVARAKRAIDELNAGRHRIVEEIDAAIDRTATQTASA